MTHGRRGIDPDYLHDSVHDVSMINERREGEPEMTDAVAELFAATERQDRAEFEVGVAETHLNALVPGAPLRYGVEATRRLRAAQAELEAAEQAYEAAHDAPAPEG